MRNETDLAKTLPKSRKYAQIERTISWIESALIELTKTGRYEDIKVSEICRKAGVGRQTFYRHYSEKDEIVKRKMGRVIDELMEDMQHNLDEDIDFISVHLAPLLTMKENKEWVKLTTIPALQTIIFAEIDVLIDLIFRRMSKNLEIDPYLKSYQVWGMKGVLLRWAQTEMKDDPEEIHSILVKALRAEGLSNRATPTH